MAADDRDRVPSLPSRRVFITGSAEASLRDIDWIERRWHADEAYSESKLLLTTLALALARLRPDVLSNAVDPGWVPSRMGGPDSPDDLALGHVTQAWLAVSDDDAARVSGYDWHHQQRRAPAREAKDPAFQGQVIDRLKLTGVTLTSSSVNDASSKGGRR